MTFWLLPVTSQTRNTKRGIWNIERGIPTFSRTPTSKIQVCCNQNQVGGRQKGSKGLKS